MKKYIYIVSGLLAVGLGTLGVVVPGLPTTPSCCWPRGFSTARRPGCNSGYWLRGWVSISVAISVAAA